MKHRNTVTVTVTVTVTGNLLNIKVLTVVSRQFNLKSTSKFRAPTTCSVGTTRYFIPPGQSPLQHDSDAAAHGAIKLEEHLFGKE
jgi:hypothetical protein